MQSVTRVSPLPLQFRRRSLNPLHEARTLIELFRLYRQEQPDLVHHVAIKPVLYGSFIAWLLGIPVAVNALAGLGFVFTSSTWRARLLHPFVCFGLRFFLNRVNGKVIVQIRTTCERWKRRLMSVTSE